MAEDSVESMMLRLITERLDPLSQGVDEEPELVAARATFLGFIKYVMPEYEVNWHHLIIIAEIQRWIDGDINRLMVFLSPQAGKSLLGSILLIAYLYGLNPDESVVAASYNAEYASKNNIAVQRVIDSDRYKRVFPLSRIAGDSKGDAGWKRNARTFEVVGRKGVYFCGGIRTGLSGRPFITGAIDDMYKDDIDANSPTIQEAVFNWYTNVFLARKSKANARIIIVNTRWTQKDLCGRLLDMAKNDPKVDQWTVVSVPAILESEAQRYPGDPREIGDALWPSRQSRRELENTRAISTSAKWSCVYQQNPTPDKGVHFSRQYFRYFWGEFDNRGQMWLVLDDGNGDEPRRYPSSECLWYQTFDASDTTGRKSDWTAMLTSVRTPDADLCFFDAVRIKVEFARRFKTIIDYREAGFDGLPWPKPIDFQSMENKSSGISMIQLAASQGTPFRILKAGTVNKEQRATAVATLYENNKVFHRKGAAFLTDFEKELINFPAGLHDDYVDTCSYSGIICVQQSSIGSTLSGELITGFEPPRDKDGRVSLVGTSMDPNANTFRMGGHEVTFPEDDDMRFFGR